MSCALRQAQRDKYQDGFKLIVRLSLSKSDGTDIERLKAPPRFDKFMQ
jgi:hypothetical protein